MIKPTISVVIPFYGDPAPTLHLIDSLRHQRQAPDFEIIVSDDTSPTPFPETKGVTVVRRPENGGFARAVNSGAGAATGRYLLILNSDLEIHLTFLRDLWHAAGSWMPAVVTAPLTSPHGTNSWTGRHFPRPLYYGTEWLTPLARFRHLRLLHELVGHDTLADGSHDEVSDWIVGALMLIPLDAYRAVNGMDESFYMNSEEVDLQLRLRHLGLPSVVLSGVNVMHEGGGSSASDSRIAWMTDGRRRYERKWRGVSGICAMEATMLGATTINFAWNVIRRSIGTEVAPIQTLRGEIQLIRHPERWIPPHIRIQGDRS